MDGLIPWARVCRLPYWYSPLESIWYHIEFGTNLRNLHLGGELWGRERNEKEDGVFKLT